MHKIKKEEHSILQVNATSNKIRFDTQSEMKECHIFIAIINKVRSNKMIAMYRRTFIIKVLFFIFIPPFFLKIGGRHSHQMFLIKLYNKNIFKTSEQVKFLEQNLINHAILILVSNYYYLLIVCEKSYSTSSSQAPLRLKVAL